MLFYIVIFSILLLIFRNGLGINEGFRHRIVYRQNLRERNANPFQIIAEDAHPREWASHPFGYMYPLSQIH